MVIVIVHLCHWFSCFPPCSPSQKHLRVSRGRSSTIQVYSPYHSAHDGNFGNPLHLCHASLPYTKVQRLFHPIKCLGLPGDDRSTTDAISRRVGESPRVRHPVRSFCIFPSAPEDKSTILEGLDPFGQFGEPARPPPPSAGARWRSTSCSGERSQRPSMPFLSQTYTVFSLVCISSPIPRRRSLFASASRERHRDRG